MESRDLIILGILLAIAYIARDKIMSFLTGATGAGATGAESTASCPPRAGGGVFEINAPAGSAWKIKGPYGFFGPSGAQTNADWVDIPGMQACIESNVCVAGTVYLRGPDGTTAMFNPVADANCISVVNW